MKKLLATVALAALVAGCGPSKPREPEPPAQAAAPVGPPSLTVTATPKSATAVEATITTNIPLPVTIMANIDLAGQGDKDIYIGYGERVTLTQPTTVVVLDSSKGKEPLPTGDYEVTADFYPRWGAEGNTAAANVPELHAKTSVTLSGSGQSSANADLQNRRQVWVMENIVMHTPWNERELVQQLGPYEKSAATLGNHDAYYFPGADMTLLRNRTSGDITIWRAGRAKS